MSMYNHRGLNPAPGTARLNELLDGIRAEFDTQQRASGEYEHNSESHIKTWEEVKGLVNGRMKKGSCSISAPSSSSSHSWRDMLTRLGSCTTDTRDANGSREGFSNGTNTSSFEAKVGSYMHPRGYRYR